MGSRLPSSDTDRPGHWLLDLTIGGTTYRFADTDLDVAQGSDSFEYHAGLSDMAVTLEAGPVSASITVEPFAAGVSWAQVFAWGADPTSGTAVLRRWFEGQDRREARVVVSGRVLAPDYGTCEEPLVFSFDSARWDSSETVPPPAAVIDDTTWPISTHGGTSTPLEPDPEAIGAYYPWVYGCPGRDAELVWGTIHLDTAATPAYVGEFGGGAHTYSLGQWVIAGHPIGANTVYITDASGGYQARGRIRASFATSTAVDLRGRTVATVVVGTGSNVHLVPGNEYWVTWPSTGKGGIQDSELGSAAPMRRAGRIIEDLLQTAQVKYNRGRMSAARSRLDRFLLDFAISEPVRPEDWVEEHLGNLLPLLRREDDDGVWWELWRYDATLADVEAHLVSEVEPAGGVPVVRTSPIGWGDTRHVENDMTLQYLPSQHGHAKSARMLGGDPPDVTVDEHGSHLCSISYTRYGRKPVQLSTDIIAEDATALLALQWRALWKALPRRSFDVEGGPELEVLEPNSVVTYTESGAYLSEALALVKAVEIGLDGVRLSLELLDFPNRRGRSL